MRGRHKRNCKICVGRAGFACPRSAPHDAAVAFLPTHSFRATEHETCGSLRTAAAAAALAANFRQRVVSLVEAEAEADAVAEAEALAMAIASWLDRKC